MLPVLSRDFPHASFIKFVFIYILTPKMFIYIKRKTSFPALQRTHCATDNDNRVKRINTLSGKTQSVKVTVRVHVEPLHVVKRMNFSYVMI